MWIDDQVLQHYHRPCEAQFFIPERPSVVLGSSNKPDIEVDEDYCNKNQIPVLKRYGGGGTVVLYSGCVVISLGLWVKQAFQNQQYFQLINQAVIDALAKWNPILEGLGQKGLSDISFGAKKVAGTSLFRSRNYLLYQGSLLVDLDIPLIEGCLKHPSKEPDYRQGRKHRDFITSLSEICGGGTPQEVLTALQKQVVPCLESRSGDELVAPMDQQFAALQARLDRAGFIK